MISNPIITDLYRDMSSHETRQYEARIVRLHRRSFVEWIKGVPAEDTGTTITEIVPVMVRQRLAKWFGVELRELKQTLHDFLEKDKKRNRLEFRVVKK